MLPAAGKSHMDRGPLFPGTWGISVLQSISDNIEQTFPENSAVRIYKNLIKIYQPCNKVMLSAVPGPSSQVRILHAREVWISFGVLAVVLGSVRNACSPLA